MISATFMSGVSQVLKRNIAVVLIVTTQNLFGKSDVGVLFYIFKLWEIRFSNWIFPTVLSVKALAFQRNFLL